MRVLPFANGTAAVVVLSILVVTALLPGARAVRISGTGLLVTGMAWFVPPPDRSPEVRPIVRRALLCRLGAMGCMVLAALAFGLRGALG